MEKVAGQQKHTAQGTSAEDAAVEKSPTRRKLYIALAYVSFALGIVGLVLPAIPTAPFVILSAWAAMRGSRKMHRWLRQHKYFGQMIRNWEDEGAVPRRAKWVATISMALGAAWLFYLLEHKWIALVMVAGMAAVAVWLWLRPEPRATAGPS